MTRPPRRHRWLVVGVLLLGAVLVLLAVRSGGARGAYPTTPEAWRARWEGAIVGAGRVPGEGWDVVEDAVLELRAAIGDGSAVDVPRAEAALDRLRDAGRVTPPVPFAAGTWDAYRAEFDMMGGLRSAATTVIKPGLEGALRRGDTGAAVLWLERGEALARVADAPGTILSLMVGDAIRRLLWEVVREHAVAGSFHANSAVAAAVARMGTGDLVWALTIERELGLGGLQELIDDFGPRRMVLASDQLRRYDEHLGAMLRYAQTADDQDLQRITRLEDALDQGGLFRLRRPHLADMILTFEHFRRQVRASALERDALGVLLALERHRAAHGRYPGTLEELVPDQLPALPADPYASDNRLRYRVIDPTGDDPATAFVLYSVGVNGVDDGGVEDPLAYGNGLRTPHHRADHLFNRPAVPGAVVAPANPAPAPVPAPTNGPDPDAAP